MLLENLNFNPQGKNHTLIIELSLIILVIQSQISIHLELHKKHASCVKRNTTQQTKETLNFVVKNAGGICQMNIKRRENANKETEQVY